MSTPVRDSVDRLQSTGVVDLATGEVVDPISADEARRLTTEARTELGSAADHFARGWALIEEAVTGGGHLSLGYRSPGDYLSTEFGGVLVGLDVRQRRAVVEAMSQWGLSTRAIAKPLGVSKDTVQRDRAGVSDATPEPATAPSSPAPSPWKSASEVLAEQDAEPEPEMATVTGIDGKQYPKPAPKPKVEPESDQRTRDEDRARAFAGHVAVLSNIDSPDRRRWEIDAWSDGKIGAPPTARNLVHPDTFRRIAAGFAALADEWPWEPTND